MSEDQVKQGTPDDRARGITVGLLHDILAEEAKQTKLLKPISTLAQVTLILLIAAVVLGVLGLVAQMIFRAALGS